MLKRLALGLLVAWAAAGFLQELNRAVTGYDHRDQAVRRLTWRFGAPEPERLTRFLLRAGREIPAGTVVAFASPDDASAFHRWRWACWILADRDVLEARDPAARSADFALSYQTKLTDPRFEPIRPLPDGWLYQVKRP